MYLKLSVAGHRTIFLTRTRGPFWSIRPAGILLMAVFGTQAVATLIAVYGLFMTPIGWGYALLVWGYALAWFLVNDRVKLLAYRIFDSPKAAAVAKAKGIAARAKAVAKPEGKAAPAPEAKAEAEPGAKGAGAPDLRSSAPADLTPKLVERVHALYEELGRQDVLAVQELERSEKKSKEKVVP
jgi:H+-transporting ATPase